MCILRILSSFHLFPNNLQKFKLKTNYFKDFKWSQTVEICLKNTFKLNSFRPLQLETINVTLSKQDCLVVMPTGGNILSFLDSDCISND